MSKLVPNKRVGVPKSAASDVVALVCYYCAAGVAPRYDQAERIEIDIADVPVTTRNGVELYVFDTSALPPIDGSYDLYFTVKDDVGNEPDFSPVVTVPLDRVAPDALGQPVVLD